jgi:hypothetical protein
MDITKCTYILFWALLVNSRKYLWLPLQHIYCLPYLVIKSSGVAHQFWLLFVLPVTRTSVLSVSCIERLKIDSMASDRQAVHW